MDGDQLLSLGEDFRVVLERAKSLQAEGYQEEVSAVLMQSASDMAEACAFALAQLDEKRDITELFLISARLARMTEALTSERQSILRESSAQG
ncbi:hypothetical protein [Litoreibacter roseus]|uniref:Uncharacterized protein n=1 Tax=Litoreibacter roseus TaxID=2601869 RepID=A0A6N6JI40_9RHOB|nr:hypothetical protein [Litoreibacter roseus]GFE66011.1 hypothetical protein KIN_30850 [Litoreibacter roseus]